jgi:outer membrane protein assembly factor BamB
VNDLYKINAQTAELSWLAKVESFNVALTFDASGNLLASDKAGKLLSIDLKNGTMKELGSFGAGLGSSGDLIALNNGKLYAVNDCCNDDSLHNNELLEVDPQKGTARMIGKIGFRSVWGMAHWRGTIYGLTQDGELLAIDPKSGKGLIKNRYPCEFWGAAVSPLAPIE